MKLRVANAFIESLGRLVRRVLTLMRKSEGHVCAHTHSIPVIYKDAEKQRDSVVVLKISDPVPLITAKLSTPELVFRSSIRASTGLHQSVMSDLYRHLVLSNYIGLDGQRGQSAALDLDKKYPDRHALPRLKQKSGRFNASGAIVSLLLEPPRTYSEKYRDAFSVVGGLLLSLVELGVLPTPVLDARPAPVLERAQERPGRMKIPMVQKEKKIPRRDEPKSARRHQGDTAAPPVSYVISGAAPDWSGQIAIVCAAVQAGDLEFARRELTSRCPLMPLPKSPRAADMKTLISSARPPGLPTKRQFSKAQASRVPIWFGSANGRNVGHRWCCDRIRFEFTGRRVRGCLLWRCSCACESCDHYDDDGSRRCCWGCAGLSDCPDGRYKRGNVTKWRKLSLRAKKTEKWQMPEEQERRLSRRKG
jgi:hypothetical protein